MPTWLEVDASTFEVLGVGSDSGTQYPTAALGKMIVPVSPAVVRTTWPIDEGPIDPVALKQSLRAKIDAEVGAVRVQFITDVPGQAQTYEKKEAEARLWIDGDEVTNPDRYPFMLAEATVRGIAIAQVRAEIMAQVNQLTPVAALMEAHRVNAKQNVLTATTLPDIIAAAVIPWQSILP